MDRVQFLTFAQVLRDFEGLCVVERDVQSEHESRMDRVRTALISLGTRQSALETCRSVREAEF